MPPAALAALVSGRAATFRAGVLPGAADLAAVFPDSGFGFCFEAFLGLRAAFMQEVAQRLVVEWLLYPRA
ncbi:hypothetical protein [Pseudoxanthomonas putridarboris]|uniref:hypothetical protein n=1 Tax=Pseudoxanthomonas putridarboris TaxID=752605 RepID=UPI00311E72A5